MRLELLSDMISIELSSYFHAVLHLILIWHFKEKFKKIEKHAYLYLIQIIYMQIWNIFHAKKFLPGKIKEKLLGNIFIKYRF